MSMHTILLCFLALLIGYGFILKALITENPIYWIGVIAFGYPGLALFRNWDKFIGIMKDEKAPVWFNVLFGLILFFLGYLLGIS